ncbi:putative RNA methyltransferase [Lactococcus protaetiae]|uniref:Methyltransferase domain-containing protein n=1 Tax=Lactococcus protaetiae TaxID=2592653 RepID=A0A514Z5R3_9LACT|nr:methyltransferase domain-containing protein [Lactococcus protaetiae]QDK69929.1 methyltransferase domain-containing protein [Lactococcus protaetiae]
MLKKIEKAYLLLEKNVEFLRCPLCHTPFQVETYALRCENKHTYNINKKGFINFLQTKADTEHYTRKMFEPRRRLIRSGMYSSVLTEIKKHFVSGNLLDVGTGEGSFLEFLDNDGAKFGFDIAKDGIEMATELETDSFLSLADLTNLPFADRSLSVILNIFTPSNYAEFHRVLSKNGRVIKVVPEQFYLQELRESYGIPIDYDNTAVVERFKAEFKEVTEQEINYTFKIPQELREDFLAMSPLEWNVSEELKKQARQNPPQQATIHVRILVGKSE